jgi:hypothetical protein
LTKEKFLTVAWNNRLTLILGLPTFIFAAAFLSTSFISDFAGFIVMVTMGVVY